ncbi:MAG: Hsp33 family molecular chaperone HslO [Oscillibacter sp.]|nr:Hsp33 family molecular chaperone HslO [Oscillibacter sp.]
MSDQLIRAISTDGLIKVSAVSTRELTERARQIHKTLPVATAALGRLLAGASMMGNALKEEAASLTLQVKGGGPLGALLAVSDHEGNVRGTVEHPAVDLPLREDGKLDVGAAVGNQGTLSVIRDLRMKEPYVGSIGLLWGEIAEDIALYFVESEQIPTACGLGVLVDRDQSVLAAGGYLLQLLPGADDEAAAGLEASLRAAGAVTELLKTDPDPESLLRRALPGLELKILEKRPIAYRCDCSRERMERALLSLGRAELEAMIAEQGGAELTCRFCDHIQRFTKEDLEALLASC